MFDAVQGELLFHYYDKSWQDRDERAAEVLRLIRNGSVRNIDSQDESMRDKLAAIGGYFSDGIPLQIHRLRVKPGEELYLINELQHLYRTVLLTAPIVPTHSEQFIIEPNLLGRLEGFTVSSDYTNRYKPSFDLLDSQNTQIHKGSGIRVRILDSGVEDLQQPFTVTAGKNYTDAQQPNDLTDDSGHGTAVAGLIHDIAPDAEIIISKVAKAGEVTAWHTLAAILDKTGEHLLNLSLSFGFSEEVCGVRGCGRSFPACRSKVFQSVIDHKLIDEPDLLVLAAAGNLPANSAQDSKEGLRYPAKYGKVIAIGCLDGNQNVYGYYGKNADDDVHRHLYFVPGGGGSEYIGTSTLGNKTTDQQGTSFSTACASGLLAVHRSNSANRTERDDILDDLRALAKPFSPRDSDKWGNGILEVDA